MPSLLAAVVWACGSGVVNYSGPAAVGLRVTVMQEPPLPNPGILWTISELTNQHSDQLFTIFRLSCTFFHYFTMQSLGLTVVDSVSLYF